MTVPTGVVTSVVGAVFLVVMALWMRDAGQTTPLEVKRIPGQTAVTSTAVALVAVLLGVVIASVLLGDAKLLLGDVTNWATGRANRSIAFILDTRVPRVTAALLAGAALALAGTLAGCHPEPARGPRRPRRFSGAGLGAVLVVTAVPAASTWSVAGAAFAGAAVAAIVVFGLAARGGSPAKPARAGRRRGVSWADSTDQPAHSRHRPLQRKQSTDLAVRLHLRADLRKTRYRWSSSS
ncbi:iron chelate uptake ABC transporter family permease subunit [Sphingomonas sp. LR61]